MRVDIQALRGIAVSIVVLFHAEIGISGGYLGVDVFFVISGYLITDLICRQLDAKQFSFAEFYWRRAKRLLPAAYATFALTTLAMVYLATSTELFSYLQQLIGAVTFTANFVLAGQINYFDTNAALKPLLHIWSLAVEEQYYFLAPLILWGTPKNLRVRVIAALLVISLVLCFAFARSKPSFAFFMLPTRSWEISIGALAALVSIVPSNILVRRVLSHSSVLILTLIAVWSVDKIHPRTDALIVCIATAIMIQTRPAILNSGPIAYAFSKLGNISYSLYLVHWPIFSLAHQVYFGPLPFSLRISCIIASILLATLLYLCIERPIHRSNLQPNWPIISTAAAGVAITIAISASYLDRGQTSWAVLRKPNEGFGRPCDQNGKPFAIRRECQDSEEPKIAVWGDSFAMHLVDGLAAHDQGYGIIQLTRSTCEPTFDSLPDADCSSFNQSVFEYLRRISSIKYVVLSTAYDPIKLVQTVQKLRTTGKKVIFVAAPPSIGVDFSRCVERLNTGLHTFNLSAQCNFRLDAANNHGSMLASGALKLSSLVDVSVIWPSDVLCEGGICRTSDGHFPLYADSDHLSKYGSIYFAEKARLLANAIAMAR